MSIKKQLGIPVPDKNGNFMIDVAEVGGEVHLAAKGHAFCKVICHNNAIIVQLIDIDTGVVNEQNVQTLCWER